jgi:hypothetical protein
MSEGGNPAFLGGWSPTNAILVFSEWPKVSSSVWLGENVPRKIEKDCTLLTPG